MVVDKRDVNTVQVAGMGLQAYAVSYKFVGPGFQMRTGTVVVQAADPAAAKARAHELLSERGQPFKVGDARLW